jgi:hypothetical protein
MTICNRSKSQLSSRLHKIDTLKRGDLLVPLGRHLRLQRGLKTHSAAIQAADDLVRVRADCIMERTPCWRG